LSMLIADKHIFAAVDATDFSKWPDGSWSCEAVGPKPLVARRNWSGNGAPALLLKLMSL
jgi:hypothetical protein